MLRSRKRLLALRQYLHSGTRKMKKLWFAAAFAVAALVGGTAGLLHALQAPAAVREVSLSSNDELLSALIYAALEEGYFTRRGLQVRVVGSQTGMHSVGDVVGGRSDFGVGADIPVMFQAMDNQPLHILATLGMSDSNMGIVARRDRHIAGLADLRGKRIGVTLGSAAHYYLDSLLVAAELPREEVTLVDLPPDRLAAALDAGTVDAVALWEFGLGDIAARLGSAGIILDPRLPHAISWCLVIRRDFGREHPDLVKALLAGLRDAEELLEKQPGELRRIVARRLRRDVGEIDRIWGRYQLGLGLDQSLIVALEEESRWAMKSRQSGRTTLPNYLEYIDFAPLAAVKPRGVTIVR